MYPTIHDASKNQLAVLNNITDNTLIRRINSFYEFDFKCFEEELKTEYIQFGNLVKVDDYFDIAMIDVKNKNNKAQYEVKCEQSIIMLIVEHQQKYLMIC